MRLGARLPGQLQDDYYHTYDVSRSYPAKPEQVNAILKASENYAEAGYGYFEWMKGRNEGGLDEEQAKDSVIVQAWMDNFLSTRVQQKKDGFLMIIRGLYRSLQARNPGEEVKDQDLLKEFSEMFNQTIINRNFDAVNGGNKMIFGSINLGSAIYSIPKNKNFNFTKLITAMIKLCRMDGNQIELTKMAKVKKPAH